MRLSYWKLQGSGTMLVDTEVVVVVVVVNVVDVVTSVDVIVAVAVSATMQEHTDLSVSLFSFSRPSRGRSRFISFRSRPSKPRF